jgi:hypothetical protein
MVNYVGKEVDIGTGLLKWEKNKLTKSTFEIDQPLANAFVEVRDSAGQVISQQELGNLMPGEHNLKWDGKLKDGRPANPGVYHFSLLGKSVEGQDVPIPIKSKVKVTGIDLKTDGGAFFTELGKIAIKDVASVGLQGFEDAKAGVNDLELPAPPGNQNLTVQAPAVEPNIQPEAIDAPEWQPETPNIPVEIDQAEQASTPQPVNSGEGLMNIPVTVAKR